MTETSAKLGLFRVVATAGNEGTPGAPILHLEMLVNAVDGTITGQGKQTQAVAAPYDDIPITFTGKLRMSMHRAMVSGQGTRDLCGPSGLTTEQFVDTVAEKLSAAQLPIPKRVIAAVDVPGDEIDEDAMKKLFDMLDTDGNGVIDYEELKRGLKKLNVAPKSLTSIID